MSISIREDYKNRQVFISIDTATHAIRRGLKDALAEIGRENKKHTKALIKNPPKTGRIYKVKGKPNPHQASAPGEAPANWTGKLMKSVRYRAYSWSRMEFGDYAPYGKWLEDGTKKMSARPHLSRTVKERSGTNFTIINKVVSKYIKK
jgi:hypothetical protein